MNYLNDKKIRRVKSRLTEQGLELDYLYFCLIIEHGFQEEDFKNLKLSDLDTVGDQVYFIAKNGFDCYPLRLGLSRIAKKYVTYYLGRGFENDFKFLLNAKLIVKSKATKNRDYSNRNRLRSISYKTETPFPPSTSLNTYKRNKLFAVLYNFINNRQDDEFLTIKSISDSIEVSRSTVYRWLDETPLTASFLKDFRNLIHLKDIQIELTSTVTNIKEHSLQYLNIKAQKYAHKKSNTRSKIKSRKYDWG